MRVFGRIGIALMSVMLLGTSIALLLPTPTDTTWSVQTLDTKASRNGVSIAVDSDDNPHLCYIASETGNYYYESSYIPTLKFLTYTNWNGSKWNIQTADPEGTTSINLGYNSLTLDSNDNPHIDYGTTIPINQTESANIIKYTTLKAAKWNIQTIDYGSKGTIEIDSEDNPHIAYSGINGELKYASWTGTNWHLHTVDPDPKESNSSETEHFLIKEADLTLDNDDHPNIIYWYSETPITESGIKWARMDSSGWTIRTVILDANVSKLGNAVMNSLGYPRFTYNNGWNYSLMYERWNGNAWIGQTVTGIQGGHTGFLRLGSNNYPHFTYHREEDLRKESGAHYVALIYSKWSGPIWGNDATWDIQIMEEDHTEGFWRKYWGGLAMPFALDSNGNPHACILHRRETFVPDVYRLPPLSDATIVYAARTQPSQAVPAEVKLVLLILLLVLAFGLLIALAYYKKRRLMEGERKE